MTTARQIINSWLAVFPAPECYEQNEVVEAAKEWLLRDTIELTEQQTATVKWALHYAPRHRLDPGDKTMQRECERLLRELP